MSAANFCANSALASSNHHGESVLTARATFWSLTTLLLRGGCLSSMPTVRSSPDSKRTAAPARSAACILCARTRTTASSLAAKATTCTCSALSPLHLLQPLQRHPLSSLPLSRLLQSLLLQPLVKVRSLTVRHCFAGNFTLAGVVLYDSDRKMWVKLTQTKGFWTNQGHAIVSFCRSNHCDCAGGDPLAAYWSPWPGSDGAWLSSTSFTCKTSTFDLVGPNKWKETRTSGGHSFFTQWKHY